MRATGRATVRLTVPEVERLLDPAQAVATGRVVLDHAPVLEPVLAALAEPEVAVRVVVARPRRARGAPGARHARRGGRPRDRSRGPRPPGPPTPATDVAREGDVQEVELSGLHPAAVPALLAGLVDLGPHRRAHGGAPADLDVVRDLFSPDDLLRTSALQLAGADSAWSVEVLAPEQEPRVLSGIDGTAGLALLLDGDDGRPAWVPSTSTDVFRTFTTVYA
ncbi:MAG: hypothetical protein PGN15_14355 [Aeromicrobium erythreum]